MLKRKGDLYFYVLLIILVVILVVAIKYFISVPLIFSPEDCYDDCSSLGYQCGEWEICGNLQDCGKCNLGMSCNSTGKCADIEFGLEKEWGEDKFWFFIFIIVIPVIIIIVILIRMWLNSRRHEDKGEVVQWGMFKKVTVEEKDKKGLDRLKE